MSYIHRSAARDDSRRLALRDRPCALRASMRRKAGSVQASGGSAPKRRRKRRLAQSEGSGAAEGMEAPKAAALRPKCVTAITEMGSVPRSHVAMVRAIRAMLRRRVNC